MKDIYVDGQKTKPSTEVSGESSPTVDTIVPMVHIRLLQGGM